MAGKTDWHQRGRDAAAEGKPCLITDARISGRSRQAWYDGYHQQLSLNHPMPETDRQEILAFLRSLITP